MLTCLNTQCPTPSPRGILWPCGWIPIQQPPGISTDRSSRSRSCLLLLLLFSATSAGPNMIFSPLYPASRSDRSEIPTSRRSGPASSSLPFPQVYVTLARSMLLTACAVRNTAELRSYDTTDRCLRQARCVYTVSDANDGDCMPFSKYGGVPDPSDPSDGNSVSKPPSF
jgi:hypothetical protein